MNTKERRSGVDVVHRCFPGGVSVLSVFSPEPLRVKLQGYQWISLASRVTKSHDQPGCAHVRWLSVHAQQVKVVIRYMHNTTAALTSTADSSACSILCAHSLYNMFMNVTSQSLLFFDFCDAHSRLQPWPILNKHLDHCSSKAGALFQ
jgi:hypothetical protein